MSRAAGATWHPSPNFGARRDNRKPSLIVIHYTAMATAAEALERLCDPVHEVSAHYLISETGTLWQLVDEKDRAWHAGAGRWGGVADVNSRSIGIELANNGRTPFAAPLMDRLEPLIEEIIARWAIEPSGVIGHSDMAPDRKSDPGPRFDWRRLARQRLSVWPGNPPATVQADPDKFRRHAVRFGYSDLSVETLLPVFRDRFRPGATGPLDAADVAAMAALAEALPVDHGGALT